MRWLVAVALLFVAENAMAAQNEHLAAVAAALSPPPREAPEDDPSRGARPELTIAKHALRDWIEAFLPRTDPGAETVTAADIAARLNKELSDAGISGIRELRIWRRDTTIIAITSFEIQCGFDDSVYGWTETQSGWKRVFSYERNDYNPEKYIPVAFDDDYNIVSFADSNDGGFYVLTAGVSTWCTSGWHARHFQLHHVDWREERAELLLDDHVYAFVAEGERGVTLGRDILEILYTTNSSDPRKAPFGGGLKMYRLDGKRVWPIPMVAADPEAFTETWLTAPWADAATRTAPKRRQALAGWHARFHPYLDIDLPEHRQWSSFADAKACYDAPNIWQYKAIFGKTRKGVSIWRENYDDRLPEAFDRADTVYFIIREVTPHLFIMDDIRRTPRPHCPAP
jgi:hypothetical protein